MTGGRQASHLTGPQSRRVFFGYPSQPRVRKDTVVRAASQIALSGSVDCVTWEDLRVSGRLIIREVLQAIDASGVNVFDVTLLNQNVLFELGYAIGRRSSIWLIRDTSDARAAREWKRFSLLQTVGYVGYSNSDQIIAAFERDRPRESTKSVYDDLIAATLSLSTPSSLFYLKSVHDTDPSRAISRAVDHQATGRFSVTVSDPSESPFQPLAWYAQTLFNTRVALVHFTGRSRTDADVHNARCALVAGLALGMGKPLLMLAEDDYSPPIDYQDLLVIYRSATEAAEATHTWIERALPESSLATAADLPQSAAVLATELSELRLGSYIAEDEKETLADYFVETASYRQVLAGATTIMIGRKGSGKSANLLRAADELGRDRRNLVCVIKPPAYELDGVLRLLRRYQEHDEKGYLVESLWKFLLFSEIAQAAAADIGRKSVPPPPDSPEAALLEMTSTPGSPFAGQFAVRLERAIDDLLSVEKSSKVEIGRVRISEALHDGVLRTLRQTLGQVLGPRRRVAVLIDNLDKAWERSADVNELSFFLLGLLGSIREVRHELARRDYWREPMSVTLCAFLRADIFAEVRKVAREPDKLPVAEIRWSDRAVLFRILEDRFASVRGGDGADIWTYFSAMNGSSVKTRIAERTLPRPRDLLYYCNAAITNAVNRQHAIIEQTDILDGEQQYSQFALESIIVEGEVVIPALPDVLYEFAGAGSILTESDVASTIGRVVHDEVARTGVVQYLQAASFLGLETRAGQFDFPEFGTDDRLVQSLAMRLQSVYGNERRFKIHPAFWSYLEVRSISDAFG